MPMLKRKNYLGPFLGLFVFVSIFLSVLSIGVSHYYNEMKREKIIDELSKDSLNFKTKQIISIYQNYTTVLFSISENEMFHNYLKEKENNIYKKNVENLFLALISHDRNVMQLRFIDKTGREKIRFERLNLGTSPKKVEEKDLQNKHDRYYFEKTIVKKDKDIFVSQLDLNEEYNTIELPPKPTVRFSTPIYLDNKIEGILIINLFMEDILKLLVKSEKFYFYLFDTNNSLLYSNDTSYLNWSKYLSDDDIIIDTKNLLLYDTIFFFNDKYEMSIGMKEKNNLDYIETFNEVFIILIFIIIPLSFFLAYLLSKIPKNLFDKLEEQQKVLIKQSKLLAMGEIIESLAHQWRQPLNAIGVLSQEVNYNLKHGNFTPNSINDLTQQIQKYIQYMSKTIDEFRNFFKPSNEIKKFDIKFSITKTLEIIKPKLKEKNVFVEIKNDENSSGLILLTYEFELKQVLLNIVNNAIEAFEDSSVKNKQIDIIIEKDNNNCTITIADNAGGIDEEIIDKIYDPYFSTKPYDLQGSGLGLHISKITIEKNLKGSIDLINSTDGATFIITLPLSIK